MVSNSSIQKMWVYTFEVSWTSISYIQVRSYSINTDSSPRRTISNSLSSSLVCWARRGVKRLHVAISPRRSYSLLFHVSMNEDFSRIKCCYCSRHHWFVPTQKCYHPRWKELAFRSAQYLTCTARRPELSLRDFGTPPLKTFSPWNYQWNMHPEVKSVFLVCQAACVRSVRDGVIGEYRKHPGSRIAWRTPQTVGCLPLGQS